MHGYRGWAYGCMCVGGGHMDAWVQGVGIWMHGYMGWAYGCMGTGDGHMDAWVHGMGIWMHGYRGWASLLLRVDTYKVYSCLDISQ